MVWDSLGCRVQLAHNIYYGVCSSTQFKLRIYQANYNDLMNIRDGREEGQRKTKSILASNCSLEVLTAQ